MARPRTPLTLANIYEQSKHRFFQNASYDLDLITRIFREMFNTEFPVPQEVRKIAARSANNDPRDPCLKNRGSTHQAWLVRAIDYAFAEIGAAQDLAGIVQSLELGMCEDSPFGRLPAAIPGDHFALAAYNGAN